MVFFKVSRRILSASFIKFCCVGSINTVIDFAVFFTLHSIFEWGVVQSNITSFSLAIANSYLMNKFWSFSHVERTKISYKEFFLFCAVSCFALAIGTAILVIGLAYIKILYLKIIATGVTLIINFLMYRFVVFGPKQYGLDL